VEVPRAAPEPPAARPPAPAAAPRAGTPPRAPARRVGQVAAARAACGGIHRAEAEGRRGGVAPLRQDGRPRDGPARAARAPHGPLKVRRRHRRAEHRPGEVRIAHRPAVEARPAQPRPEVARAVRERPPGPRRGGLPPVQARPARPHPAGPPAVRTRPARAHLAGRRLAAAPTVEAPQGGARHAPAPRAAPRLQRLPAAVQRALGPGGRRRDAAVVATPLAPLDPRRRGRGSRWRPRSRNRYPSPAERPASRYGSTRR
jgi:hypothetical protein